MKKFIGFSLALLLLGVAISGCIGGSPTEVPTETTTPEEQGYTSTPTPTQSQPQGNQHSTTTTTPLDQSTTQTQTQTETQTSTGTQTQTEVEEAYWSPWNNEPIEVNGKEYKIVGYQVNYKVQPSPDSETYEYKIEKSVRKVKVHIYGMSLSGGKVDLGEQEVYEYLTVITPIKAMNMEDKLIFRFWLPKESNEMFLYPWDVGWLGFFSPMGSSGDFSGLEFEYMGEKLTITNPTPYKSGLFPYVNGNGDFMEEVSDDLNNLYMGWAAMINLALWSAWSDKNVLVPQHGSWSDGLHSWKWKTNPDGNVELSGMTFRVVNAEWNYSGGPENIDLSGKGRFSPKIPIPLYIEGRFYSKDPETGEEVEVYGEYELEDMKLEEI
ncbi:hypothetical protein [Pyrococcus abyssi]|nr:hypothetical protein [Pyrococcus abyssi]